MQLIFRITQLFLCLVSMLLTSLFALSLSGAQWSSFENVIVSGSSVYKASLFLFVGFSIDLAKYVFWVYRRNSLYFVGLSFFLMLFSWFSSCVFFAVSEQQLIVEAKSASLEAAVIQAEIDSVYEELSHQERLLNNRLASIYHSQWLAGEENVQQIIALRKNLSDLKFKLSTAGHDEALVDVPVTHVFFKIGEALDVDTDYLRWVGYGALGLLLELSALGMIALSGESVGKNVDSETCGASYAYDISASGRVDGNVENFQIQKDIYALHRICHDILSGRVLPVLRRIKSAGYGVDLKVIRHILQTLSALGLIKPGKRGSYELIDRDHIEQ